MNKTLDVYLEQDCVGQLVQNQHGQIMFTYGHDWLNRRDAVPLSTSLPLRAEPFREQECRGFFAGILPEESNREIIAKILGVSARNDYAMLEQIGGECAGAITFLPQGLLPPERTNTHKPLNEHNLADILRQLPRRPLMAGEPGLRLSLAGAQNKIAVHVAENGTISLPLNGTPSTHILKPAVARFPHIVANEALCLRLAAKIGIPSAIIQEGHAEDIEYLLVQRYDRVHHENNLTRLHQEDFCQALGIVPTRKYQNEGGPSLKDCFALLRQVSRLPAVDVQHLLGMVIFNLIVGNNDAHGKNFSFLFYGDGHARLAPAYDILSTVYYPELTSKMAMKIGDEYESVKLIAKDIDVFAVMAGLSAPAVRKRFGEVAQKVKLVLPEMRETFPAVGDLIDLIDARAQRIMRMI